VSVDAKYWLLPTGDGTCEHLPQQYDLPPKIELTGDEVTIGRDTPAEIVLAYPTVSGAHCQIAMVDRDFYIMDLSSTNGTFVNGATSISSTSTRPFAHPTNPKPYLTALALRD
jgi:pSer/pThr/pTyr-binding forkhead associated (FHA) protein